jgi:carbon storage regulator
VLVFTRKLDEAIVIGDGIEVRVLRVGRDGVRLGVTAPSHVAVHRREVYDLIKAANVAAAANPEAFGRLAARLRERTAMEAAAGGRHDL